MSNQNNLKISHIFELPNLSFKSQMNIAIDSNAHIKSVINVHSYLFDTETETINGKCNIKGKIGLKILYLDVDNVYNTLTDETTFYETVASNDLTVDCRVGISNEQISNNVDFDDKYLKISMLINAHLLGSVDVGINLPDTNQNSLIVQKDNTNTNCCIETVNNKTSEDCKIELPQTASKILSLNILPSIEKVECNDGYLTIAGTSIIQVLYEVESEESCGLKMHTENQPFKFESQATLCTTECVSNINMKCNHSKTSFATEFEENRTTLKIDYEYDIKGFVFKPVNLEFVKDIYSLENELESSFSKRDMCNLMPHTQFKHNLDGEIEIADNTIDEILECLNHSCLITQATTIDKKITIEGVITSTLIYFDEQKDIKSIQLELPFSLQKDFDLEENCQIINIELIPLSCKAKIKRGNIIVLDYELSAQGNILNKHQTNMLDNIKYGKNLDYSEYAFQIILARKDESLWEFCKRTHTSQERLMEYNHDLPMSFAGGEKIVIYR